MRPRLRVMYLGNQEFKETYQLQMSLVKKRAVNESMDTLLLVEHLPVITVGRDGSLNNLLLNEEELKEKGIDIYETNRGGDITYHGPGQLVGYPILNLKNYKKDLHWLLRAYEQVFIELLKKFNIKGTRIPGLTGVWVGDKKITSIGIGVKRWVSYHGFAFNINPDLSNFNYIIPCGIEDKGVTSLQEHFSAKLDKKEIINSVIKYFKLVFNPGLTFYEEK